MERPLTDEHLHERSEPPVRATSATRASVLSTRAASIGAVAIGAAALGATAIGALAIGSVVVGALRLKRGHVRSLAVEHLHVGRLQVRELLIDRETEAPADMGERKMDEDLADLERDALVAEVKRLRAGIREHRDSFGHELCWHHPKLWGLLPEKTDPLPSVPAWSQFLRGCIQYRESLDRQLPATPRTDDEFTGRR